MGGFSIAEEELIRINKRLRELADGYIEIIDVDRGSGRIRIKLVGGVLC